MRSSAVHRHILAGLKPQEPQSTLRIATRAFGQYGRRRSQNSSDTNSKDQKDNDKAPFRSKVFAFGVGGAVSLAYAAYKGKYLTSSSTTAATPDGFVKYTVVDKEPVSSTCSIFTIAPQGKTGLSLEDSKWRRSIVSVELKQPQLQIARSYTVLPAVAGQSPNTLRFLIRRELNGEVSGYLHGLPLGSELEVRGPRVDFRIPEDVREVLFLAGGTGIAPALKAADALDGTAKLHIMWANRRREECAGGTSDTIPSASWAGMISGMWARLRPSPQQATTASIADEIAQKNTIVLMLDLLKRQLDARAPSGGGSLTVDYFVDDEYRYISPGAVSNLLKRAPSTEDHEPGSKIVFVSGPEGFISHWAGSKEFVGGREEQGTLGGVLSRLQAKGWLVVKL